MRRWILLPYQVLTGIAPGEVGESDTGDHVAWKWRPPARTPRRRIRTRAYTTPRSERP